MNIIQKIFKRNINTSLKKHDSSISMSMQEKEKHIFCEDKFNRQRLYEKWSCKDKWILYDEGIPLLFGIEPGSSLSEEQIKQKINVLWLHAKDCINKGLLSVINNDLSDKEWEVKPVNLYRWATVSRVDVPQELSCLMEFILQTVKRPEVKREIEDGKTNNQIESDYQRHKELTLGAAVSLLVNMPEICKNKKGQVTVQLISSYIMAHSKLWFAREKPLLAKSAMDDLINQYIKKS